MRLVQLFVPSDDKPAVRETLADMDVEYLFSDADDHRDGAIAYVPAPTGAVDAILDRLYDAGLDEDTYTVITDVHHATVPGIDDLTDEYVAGPKGGRAAPHAELRERAEDLKPETVTYIAFAALSAVVAVGGLLLNSAIVIVGAMVIAPFAGSTLSASVGAVISDQRMVVDSATSQVLGLLVAFGSAVLMSVFLRQTGFVPASLVVSRIDQVSAFLTPNLLTLAIAIAAGLAGALALATDLPVSIAGVAVAAAIVPAAATAAIGAVWRQPLIVLGGVVLLLMNIVFINLAAYVALISLGYRSTVFRNVRENVSVSVRTGVYAVVLVAFVAAVLVTTAGTAQHLGFERGVNREVESTLETEPYDSLDLVSVKTGYSDMNVLGRVEEVSVTVSRSSDTDYPDLASELQGRISDSTNRPVSVSVRFLDYQVAQPADTAGQPPSLWSRARDRAAAVWDRLTRVLGATAVSPSGAAS